MHEKSSAPLRLRLMDAVALSMSTIFIHGAAFGQTTIDIDKSDLTWTSGLREYYLSNNPGLRAFKPPIGLVSVPITPVNVPLTTHRSNDTMKSGTLLSLYHEDALTPASLQQTPTNLTAFYKFGGVGDSGAHPLSSITSFGVVNTTNYTIAQWKALFASAKDSAGNNPVTSLSNEADEVAIQAMINTQGTVYNSESIVLPSAWMRVTHPLRSGCFPIDIKGQGRNSTQLYLVTPMTDLWHHGTADTACPSRYGTHFSISDLTVRSSGIENRAFDIAQGLDSKVVFSNVDVVGSPYTSGNSTMKGTGTFYLNGIRCTSCSNVIFSNTYIIGPYGNAGAIAGTGLEIAGGGTGSMLFRGGFIGGYHQCVLSYTGSVGTSFPTSTNGDNEGLVFDGMQSTGCDDIYTAESNGSPDQGGAEYYILNGQYGTTGRHFLNMTGMHEVFIDHNLIYTNSPFLVGGGTFIAGSNTILGVTYLNSSPAVGSVITGSFESLPAGTTVTAVSTNPNTITMSNKAGNSTGNVALSFQPTQAFAATGTAGSTTLTGVSKLASDASGYMYAQKDGCVYGVPSVTGCDKITAIDGYNMTVTVAIAPNSSGLISGSFHYPETPPILYLINGTSDVHIARQDLQMPPGTRIGAAFGVANSSNVHIEDWDINDLGNVMTAGFYDQGGNKNLIENGTTFFGPGWNNSGASLLVSNPFASNDVSVRWGSYFKSIGCDLGTSGTVTCSGSTIGTLSKALDFTVPLPNAYLNAPQIMAMNGDASFPSFCGVEPHAPNGDGVTKAFFYVKCPGAFAGTSAHINWTAIGK